MEPADAPDVMCVQPLRLPSADLATEQVAELERRAKAEDAAGVLEQLRVIIPEFRATPESRAEAAAEGFGVPLAQPLRTPTHHRCPQCESTNIHRSHVRSWTERVKKEWSHRRPYRCQECGWRGWLIPLAEVHVEGLADVGGAVDLTSIDAGVRDQTKPTRPAFSPRSLR